MSYLRENPFQITEKGNLRLIVPNKVAAVSNAAWTRDNLWHRSRVETLDGETVSQSFGKFFNLGMGPEGFNYTTDDIAVACQNRDAIATLKVDGSTLIRSVYNDTVMFRTRGSFGYEFLDNADEIPEFCKRYPQLADPTMYRNYSLLFEWVSPRNVIVIKYPEPELHLIGAVLHVNMTYVDMTELGAIARSIKCPLVQNFRMDEKGWESLQGTLEKNNDIEGYVIRMHNEQTLVKVKCAPYLTKHALKSNLTTEKLTDLWLDWSEPNYLDYIAHFRETFDEETAWWAMPVISKFFDGVREFSRMRDHLHALVAKNRELPRKEFALLMQQNYGTTKKMAYAMLQYSGQPVKRDLLKSLVLQCTQQEELGILNEN